MRKDNTPNWWARAGGWAAILTAGVVALGAGLPIAGGSGGAPGATERVVHAADWNGWGYWQ